MHNVLNPVFALKLALSASILSLAAAFAAQYGFGLRPCHLCLLQRVPYGIVMVLALMGLRSRARYFLLLLLAGLTFLTGSGIAAYHAAVEKQWIAGPAGCTAQSGPAGESPEDFLKRLEKAPLVTCDQAQWEFHGLTLAGMNALWSLALAGFMLAAARQSRRGAAHA